MQTTVPTTHGSAPRRTARSDGADNKPLVGQLQFRFKNPIVDAYFSYVLAFGQRGGADVGEAFYAASQIRQYDTESWVRAFTEMAARVGAQAEDALERGHHVTARQTLLRASALDRAALMALSPLRFPDRYRQIRERVRERFDAAVAMVDPPFERIAIPFEGRALRGYFIRPDAAGGRRPTLINAGGGESLVEDMCFLFGLGDGERGYNVLTVDMPGQGSTALDGMRMSPDAERPLRAVVDFALSRPDVDPSRLAVYGPSFGGYAAARAAANDDRIKALITNSMILNLHDYLVQAKELGVLARLERAPGFALFTRLTGSWLAGLYNVMDTWKWKWGVASMAEWLEVCKQYVVDPAQIACPTLMLVGEDEYAYPASRRFHDEALTKIRHPRKDLVVGRTNLGAGGKNLLPNVAAIRNTTFDWLDEVFAAS